MIWNGSEKTPLAVGLAVTDRPITVAEKSKTLHIALVGLDSNVENRVKAACWRLSGRGYDVRLQGWSGVECDLLVVGSTDSHARVLDTARERRIPMLRFVAASGTQATGADEITTGSSVEKILHKLQALLDPLSDARARPTRTLERPSGLLWLMIERRPTSGAIHAVSESYEIWITGESGLVCARTHSDLIGARERLLSPRWVFQRVRTARVAQGPTIGVDEFFLDGCMRAAHRLPLFVPGNYFLRRQPVGTTSQSAREIAALAAQFGAREEVSSVDLASFADVSQHHANAFLWATMASGALQSRSGDGRDDNRPPGFFDRVRTRLGLGKG